MLHPYLFVTGYDAANFRERVKNDAKLEKRYRETVLKAEEYLKEDFITEEQANEVSERLQNKFGSDVEIAVINGGQPVYYYMISIE